MQVVRTRAGFGITSLKSGAPNLCARHCRGDFVRTNRRRVRRHANYNTRTPNYTPNRRSPKGRCQNLPRHQRQRKQEMQD
eukprot:7755984-Heterocapsa_arctica.AAC.1